MCIRDRSSLSPACYAHTDLLNDKSEETCNAFPLINKKSLFANEAMSKREGLEMPVTTSPSTDRKKRTTPRSITRRRDKVEATKIAKKEGSLVTVRRALELYNALRSASSASCREQKYESPSCVEDKEVSGKQSLVIITELKKEEEAIAETTGITKSYSLRKATAEATEKIKGSLFSPEHAPKDKIRSPRSNMIIGNDKKKLNLNPKKEQVSKKPGAKSNFISIKSGSGKKKKQDKGKSSAKYNGLIKADDLIIQKELSYKITKLQEAISRSRPLLKFSYKNPY
eukprot:TRINITY_DN14530_c0_g2_i6.p1 TRINITY_DN14530_c0_g2~~TRINITY_DN14530_c0_g2_i6.p1  ORF type:complete len:284 (+),score=69.32 TRINITY_DN14530_c0_g2_i6:69-920(+)